MDSKEIQLYFLPLSASQSDYDYFFKTLEVHEQQKAQGFLKENSQRQFVICRGVMKCLIAQSLNKKNDYISISYNNSGKPYLESNSKVFFNLSHSKDYALMAMSFGNEVGVDIEACDESRNWKSILDKNFSEAEKQYIHSSSQKEEQIRRFYQIWTLKEAFIKCQGTALLDSLEQVALPVHQIKEQEAFSWGNLTLLSLKSPKQNYQGALAVRGPISSVKIHQIKIQDFIS